MVIFIQLLKVFVYKQKFPRRLHWCLCKPWKSFKPMKEHKFISLNTFSSNTECNFKYPLSLSKYKKIDQNILIFAKIVEQKLLVLLFMTFLCRFPFFSITLQHMKIKYVMQTLQLIYRRSWKLVWHIKTFFPTYTYVFLYIVWICKYEIKSAFQLENKYKRKKM